MFSALFALSAMTAGLVAYAAGDDNRSLGMRTRQYLVDLIRLDTSNPPGNESKVATYLKQVADTSGIPAELLGDDPKRLNLVARLKGNGKNKPLLLMAHSDVVPAERKQWTVDPFKGEVRDEYLYGRGALDTKSLLAAELAVMVEIKRRNIKLSRDLILLSEADEEAGSSGIQWLIQHAWPKIDAEFAFNEGGSVWESKNGTRVFLVQTAEKIPTRVVLTAKGPAGHGSLPRSDNAVLRLSRALVKLADADQPVRLTLTTRRYLRELSAFPEYDWLPQLVARLDNPATVQAAAGQIRTRDPELDAALRTTVTPTMLNAGIKINSIPSTAEAQVDVRRLPTETAEEVLARFRQIVADPAVEIALVAGAATARHRSQSSHQRGVSFAGAGHRAGLSAPIGGCAVHVAGRHRRQLSASARHGGLRRSDFSARERREPRARQRRKNLHPEHRERRGTAVADGPGNRRG